MQAALFSMASAKLADLPGVMIFLILGRPRKVLIV
jgi:hypothetical protein